MNNKETLKLIINSTLPLIIAVVLFITAGIFATKYFRDTSLRIATAKADGVALSTKLRLLKAVSQRVATDSTAASIALPESNPSLMVFWQLKSLAASHNVIISELTSRGSSSEAAGAAEGELVDVGVRYSLTGQLSDILAFLGDLEGISPLVTVTSVELSVSAGTTIAEVGNTIYWAALPKTLPAITAPVVDLTDDERQTLAKISALSTPQFSSLPPPVPGGRDDPFTPQQ